MPELYKNLICPVCMRPTVIIKGIHECKVCDAKWKMIPRKQELTAGGLPLCLYNSDEECPTPYLCNQCDGNPVRTTCTCIFPEIQTFPERRCFCKKCMCEIK